MARRVYNTEEALELVQADGSDIDSSDDESEDEYLNDPFNDPSPGPSTSGSSPDSTSGSPEPGPSRPRTTKAPPRKRARPAERRRTTEGTEEWTEDLDGIPEVFPFTGQTGLNVPADAVTPLDFFQLFFSHAILRYMKTETNRYAAQEIRKKENPAPNSMFRTWKLVTINELRGFLAILIHMMLVKKSTISDYWSTCLILTCPFPGLLMPRNRFCGILSFFHLNDNTSQVPHGNPGFDPLHKLRPLYDHLKNTFATLYYPQRKVSIDEAMCPWRGRLRFRVYIKDKPTRWGVKLYELCESSSGYVYDFEVYAGDPTISNRPVDVCLRLMEPLLDQGHVLYTDNYYTCPELTALLLDRGTSTVGTVRKNRVGMPKALQERTLRQGDVAFMRKGKVVALKWMDKKEVNLLSTIHSPADMVTVRTRTGEKRKPAAVDDYTQNMAGVDKSDQIMAYHPLRRRSLKWWKKLFFHFLTLTIVQSQILYNKAGRGRRLPLRDFVVELGMQMMKKYLTDKDDMDEDNPPTPTRQPTPTPPKKPCYPCYIPPTETKARPQRRCVLCTKQKRRKETSYMCKQCGVALCVDPCFEGYHEQL